jgi:hypothetical protein
MAWEPAPFTTESWSPAALPMFTMPAARARKRARALSVSRPPAVMLTRSSVVVRVPPARVSAGPFRLSWPPADEITSPLRDETVLPSR